MIGRRPALPYSPRGVRGACSASIRASAGVLGGKETLIWLSLVNSKANDSTAPMRGQIVSPIFIDGVSISGSRPSAGRDDPSEPQLPLPLLRPLGLLCRPSHLMSGIGPMRSCAGAIACARALRHPLGFMSGSDGSPSAIPPQRGLLVSQIMMGYPVDGDY